MKQHLFAIIRNACMTAGFAAAALAVAAAHAANSSDWWVNIANDRAGAVKTMLARGADPNELSPKGQPAIMQAVRDGAWAVYDVLAADRRTALNQTNANGETPLMYLAVVGETKRAQALIKRGAQVNRLGWTPLHYAASTGKLDTVKMLIAQKAIVNAPGPDGTTPLMMAAYGGSAPVVQFLLNAGADATTRNLQKQNAADWARVKKHDALAAQLDAVAQKTMAQRATMRARRQADEAAAAYGGAQAEGGQESPEGHAPVRTVDIVPMESAEPDKKAEQPAAGQNSSSRYFDLDRFNKPSEP